LSPTAIGGDACTRSKSTAAASRVGQNRNHDLEREIEACRNVSRRAGELALKHAARGLSPEDKSDDSPVTAADRECEQLIERELRAAFPDDGFLGEEGASGEGRSGRRWIIDPIDGTRDFIRGYKTWSNLIGLEADGEVVLGVCNLPAQGELYWAVRGRAPSSASGASASRRSPAATAPSSA
jgi:fructose-1,6-bisphosphatase/inositol monophosphatase family enzyme